MLYVYAFREYCLQLITYSGSALVVVERVVNVRYYYYYYYHYYLRALKSPHALRRFPGVHLKHFQCWSDWRWPFLAPSVDACPLQAVDGVKSFAWCLEVVSSSSTLPIFCNVNHWGCLLCSPVSALSFLSVGGFPQKRVCTSLVRCRVLVCL